MRGVIAKFVFYFSFSLFLFLLLPFSGEFKFSNKISEYMFLRGDKLAVTFPWKGVLIKEGVSGDLLGVVIKHEICHVNQIDRLGGIAFILEYNKSPENFEKECYEND